MNYLASKDDYFKFVRSIGETKSKHEEDSIIIQQLHILKQSFREQSITVNYELQKEFLMRIMYVDMLGHDASMGLIQAIKLCTSTNINEKNVGYLLITQLLSPDHPLRFMIVNQIQRDLNSPSFLVVTTALLGLNKVLTDNIFLAIKGFLKPLFKHDNVLVKQLLLSCFEKAIKLRFLELSEQSQVFDHIFLMIKNGNLPLIAPCVSVIREMTFIYPLDSVVLSLCQILQKVADHNCPKAEMYHKVPTPFMQITILRFLRSGSNILSMNAKQKIIQVVTLVLERNKAVTSSVAFSILGECIFCLASFEQNFQPSIDVISVFFRHPSLNFKAIGLKALTLSVENNCILNSHFKEIIIECLINPSIPLEKNTVKLLFNIVNTNNIEFILQKMFCVLELGIVDLNFKHKVFKNILKLAVSYASSSIFVLEIVLRAFELTHTFLKEKNVATFIHWLITIHITEILTKIFEWSSFNVYRSHYSWKILRMLSIYVLGNVLRDNNKCHADLLSNIINKDYLSFREKELTYLAIWNIYKSKALQWNAMSVSLKKAIDHGSHSQNVRLSRLTSFATFSYQGLTQKTLSKDISNFVNTFSGAKHDQYVYLDSIVDSKESEKNLPEIDASLTVQVGKTVSTENFLLEISPSSMDHNELLPSKSTRVCEVDIVGLGREHDDDLLNLGLLSNVQTRSIVLKPCTIPIESMGNEWNSLVTEKRISVQCESFPAIMKTIRSKLLMSEVKVLEESKEVIFVAAVFQADVNTDLMNLDNSYQKELGKLLLHVQIKQGPTQFIIRSNKECWNDVVALQLQNALGKT